MENNTAKPPLASCFFNALLYRDSGSSRESGLLNKHQRGVRSYAALTSLKFLFNRMECFSFPL